MLGQQQVTSVSLVVDAAWAFADKEQTVLARDVTVNGESFPRGEHGNGRGAGHGKSPAQQCRAERQLDPAGFKARWGANGGKANAFGKCVSAAAKAKHGAKAPHAERGRGDDAKVSAHGRSHGAGKGHGHS